MKKLFTLLILAALISTAALTGCNNASTQSTLDESSSQTTGTIAATEVETEAPTEAPTQAESSAIAPGSFVEHDNYKISFEMAKQYDEIQGDNEFLTATPADGKKYLVLFFEFENISDEDQYVNIYYQKAYLDDYDIDSTLLVVEPEGYSTLAGDVAPGKKLKGYVAYEVDPDWQKLEFTYTDGLSADSPSYDFVVTPDDLS